MNIKVVNNELSSISSSIIFRSTPTVISALQANFCFRGSFHGPHNRTRTQISGPPLTNGQQSAEASSEGSIDKDTETEKHLVHVME